MIEFEFMIPGADIVGFEYVAKCDADIASINKALHFGIADFQSNRLQMFLMNFDFWKDNIQRSKKISIICTC